jgi:phage tail tape-measure protein
VRYDRAEKIVVSPDETVPITLQVAANIRSRQGRVLIPAGTEVSGRLEPEDDGVRFVARSLRLYGNSVPFDAVSEVVDEREEVNRNSTGSILKGAAIGAGAAAILAAVTGDRKIGLGEIIGGAGIGALGGWILRRNQKAEVIVIEPDRELELTLQSDLALR